MSKINLGKILKEGDALLPERDAVHVPILKAVTMATFSPGQRVAVIKGVEGWEAHEPYAGETTWAVIDPFISRSVKTAEEVYLLIQPGKLQNLWHDWYMPQIDGPRCESKGEKT